VRHCPAAEQLPTTKTHCCPDEHSELVAHAGPEPDDEPPDDEPPDDDPPDDEPPDDDPPDDEAPEDEPPEDDVLPEDDPPSGESPKLVVEPPHAVTHASKTNVTAVERSMAGARAAGVPIVNTRETRALAPAAPRHVCRPRAT
jgi:hypothetical protein